MFHKPGSFINLGVQQISLIQSLQNGNGLLEKNLYGLQIRTRKK